MNDLVERVALALYLDENQDAFKEFPDFATTDGWGKLIGERGKEMHRKRARIAIEAMRELPEDPGPRYGAGEYSRRTQAAMVDDALAEKQEH